MNTMKKKGETPPKSEQNDNVEDIEKFRSRLAKKYGRVLDEPVPEKLAELVRQLREIDGR